MLMLTLLLPLALLGVMLGMERVERWVSNDLARTRPDGEAGPAVRQSALSGAAASPR
jgi:hypothetical protein